MSTGLGDLPRVQQRTCDGALVEICLVGAHSSTCGLADMQPQDFLYRLCVEAAAIGQPTYLQSGHTSNWGQTLTYLLD